MNQTYFKTYFLLSYILANANQFFTYHFSRTLNVLLCTFSYCLALASLKEDLSKTKSEIEEKHDNIEKLKKKLDNCTKRMAHINE